MQVKRVDENLSEPGASGWDQVSDQVVALQRVPIDAQPTEYIRVKWADLDYGDTPEVSIRAAHDGANVYVRLEWAKDAPSNGEFHDAAAMLTPASGDAPARTMGSADAPVQLWLWQDGLAYVRNLDGVGPGAFSNHADDGSGATAQAANAGGRWQVAFSTPLASLQANGQVGFAVWNGANEERAGLGAVSEWVALEFG